MSAQVTAGRPIAVLGAGTLGRRIALMFASQGGVVRIHDVSPQQRSAAEAYVEKRLPRLLTVVADGSRARIELADDLADAVADAWLVIESLPERLELKRKVFAELDRLAPADAILASNSSSYPTAELADAIRTPSRLLNLHFFMPPQITAVELMSSGSTDKTVLRHLMDTLPRYGLTPFEAKEQSLGFIYNRIWAAIKRESLAVAADGVAGPAEVDQLFKMVLGTQLGPFAMMDMVGLDVVLDIEEHYAAERPGIPEGPRELLKKYIAGGRLGQKTGHGFYDYDDTAGT